LLGGKNCLLRPSVGGGRGGSGETSKEEEAHRTFPERNASRKEKCYELQRGKAAILDLLRLRRVLCHGKHGKKKGKEGHERRHLLYHFREGGGKLAAARLQAKTNYCATSRRKKKGIEKEMFSLRDGGEGESTISTTPKGQTLHEEENKYSFFLVDTPTPLLSAGERNMPGNVGEGEDDT